MRPAVSPTVATKACVSRSGSRAAADSMAAGDIAQKKRRCIDSSDSDE